MLPTINRPLYQKIKRVILLQFLFNKRSLFTCKVYTIKRVSSYWLFSTLFIYFLNAINFTIISLLTKNN